MARIDWIRCRLNNWALWKVRGMAGGLGFSRQAAFLAMHVDGNRESPLPIDDIDAEKTDRAVESLRDGKGHLHMTLQLHYIKGMGIKAVAAKMARAESTIKANLEQADHALQAWFNDQAEIQQQKKATNQPPGGLST